LRVVVVSGIASGTEFWILCHAPGKHQSEHAYAGAHYVRTEVDYYAFCTVRTYVRLLHTHKMVVFVSAFMRQSETPAQWRKSTNKTVVVVLPFMRQSETPAQWQKSTASLFTDVQFSNQLLFFFWP
jgi:hypothetical protein